MIQEIIVPSNKHSARMGAPHEVVVHDTAGLMDGCLTWLRFPPPQGSVNSSVHLIVDKQGEVYRLVPDERAAWHCRGHNSTSLGIELERAKDDEEGEYPPRQLYAAAECVASWCTKYRIPMNRIYSHAELDPQRRRDPRNFDWYGFLIEVSLFITK